MKSQEKMSGGFMFEGKPCQVFRRHTGGNICNYINTKRIEAMKQLHRETGSKIIDIAYYAGLDNLTYFNRPFKKQTGYSPKEFRKVSGPRIFKNEIWLW